MLLEKLVMSNAYYDAKKEKDTEKTKKDTFFSKNKIETLNMWIIICDSKTKKSGAKKSANKVAKK